MPVATAVLSSVSADAEAAEAAAGAPNVGWMKLKTPNGLSVIWLAPTSNGLKNRGRTFTEPREAGAFCACAAATTLPNSAAAKMIVSVL